MSRPELKPFVLLQSLEQRGRDHRAVLPQQEAPRREWVGIGFRLGGRRLVAPLDEVTEILTYPQLSPIPRTKSWVRGIANVRGTLLPIMDLGGYLGRAVTLTRLTRVMVIRRDELAAGLVVDEVLGMRHFYRDELRRVPKDADESLMPYITGSFPLEEGTWYVFSMRALAQHPQFLKVAS